MVFKFGVVSDEGRRASVMSGAGFVIMALIGLVLFFWGARQMRRGLKELDRIGEEFGEIGRELEEIQQDVNESMSKL